MENKEIKTFDAEEYIKAAYKKINSLASFCAEKNSLPYTAELPFPEDMNVVSGTHLDGTNRILLELKAGSVNAKSLKWIFASDAVLAGLELKNGSDCEPVIAAANVRRGEKGNEVDLQAIYLMDQFTDESIKRIYEQDKVEKTVLLDGNKKAQKKLGTICRNMIRNISEYDTGIKQEQWRKSMRSNIKNNYSNNTSVYKEIKDTMERIFEVYSPEQKKLFQYLTKYYTKQQTGLAFSDNRSESEKNLEKEEINSIIKKLAQKDSPLLAKTLTESCLFAERTAHLDFALEHIYTHEDRTKNQNILTPEAGKFEHKQSNEITHERIREERLRSNSRQITPPRRGR